MAINRTPIFPETITLDGATIVAADAVAAKALSVAGANGRNIRAVSCVSDDTALMRVTLSILKGGVTYRIGESAIPIGAGTNGTAKAVNLLNSADATWLNADGSLDLAPSTTLQVAVVSTVTAAKTLYFVAFGGDY